MIFSQKKPATYDVVLAKSFNADDNGMKKYVFCIFLKTGNNINATKAEKNKAFEGHMANINRLATEGELVVAGPFMKNDKKTVEFLFLMSRQLKRQALVETYTALKSKMLETDLTLRYSSAALLETTKIHDKIARNKF